MSILTDYNKIRKDIGEERYKQIELFLEAQPQYKLSDIYYSKEIWDKSESWLIENKITPAPTTFEMHNDDIFDLTNEDELGLSR